MLPERLQLVHSMLFFKLATKTDVTEMHTDGVAASLLYIFQKTFFNACSNALRIYYFLDHADEVVF